MRLAPLALALLSTPALATGFSATSASSRGYTRATSVNESVAELAAARQAACDDAMEAFIDYTHTWWEVYYDLFFFEQGPTDPELAEVLDLMLESGVSVCDQRDGLLYAYQRESFALQNEAVRTCMAAGTNPWHDEEFSQVSGLRATLVRDVCGGTGSGGGVSVGGGETN